MSNLCSFDFLPFFSEKEKKANETARRPKDFNEISKSGGCCVIVLLRRGDKRARQRRLTDTPLDKNNMKTIKSHYSFSSFRVFFLISQIKLLEQK
jgi:hypothetical protein